MAVCQILVIDGDREGNFRRIENALEEARRGRAAIATFPESAILGWQNPDAHRMAAPIPGADIDRIAGLASRFGTMISIGLDEKSGAALYGAAVVIDGTGRLLLRHRKLNVLAELMDPPYATGREEDIAVVETEFGRIGMVICADTFVDSYARRVEDLRPDLMLIPYGWAAPVDRWPAHAGELERLVCRRARQWRCPVVGTNPVGAISQGPWRGQIYGAASVVADGAGNTLAVLRDRDVEIRVVELRPGRRAESQAI